MNITISLGCEDYVIKKLLDLVNSVVIKCSLSLKDGTDKSTCKKNISKAKNGTELAQKLQESV